MQGHAGEVMAQDFLAWAGVGRMERITEVVSNATWGDLESWETSATAEVKSQDVGLWPQQTIEVGRLTDRGRPYDDGVDRMAASLRMSVATLLACSFTDMRKAYRPRIRMGEVDLSELVASFTASSNAEFTLYVNVRAGWVYLYDKHTIVRDAREAVLAGAMTKGRGLSSSGTFSVWTPTPAAVWQRQGGLYAWAGAEGEDRPWLTSLIEAYGPA